MPRALASAALCLSLIAGCASPAASVSPSPGSTADASPTTVPSSGTPAPTGSSTTSPSPLPVPAASPPLPRSAREVGLEILMAPRGDGTIFVSFPGPGGSVLTLLDRSGSPLPGWPIVVPDATACDPPLPVGDGSVRVVCTMENPEGDMYSPISAFAFDSAGRLLDGWPVGLRGSDYTGRAVGDVLTLAETIPLGDVIPDGQPRHTVGLVTVAADGGVRSGAPVPIVETWPWPWPWDRWAIGLDGVAYGVQGSVVSATVSQITAIDGGGVRAGWPISIDGIASGPSFAADGRIILTVAMPGPGAGTTRVVVVDPDGGGVLEESSELLIETGVLPPTGDGDYECGAPVPRPPLVAHDGTIFVFSTTVFSEIDDAPYGLDSSLDVLSGWPIVAGRLERPSPWLGQDGITCAWLAVPAAGPDGTLYLPLIARNSSTGGRLLAVGADGGTRTGWPVELRRAGSEFWSVVAGPDGTTYALAIEPEAGGGSSATILAIEPDSTVRYTRTVIEP